MVPSVPKVIGDSRYKVSEKMTRILRENDGAIEWRAVFHVLSRRPGIEEVDDCLGEGERSS